MINDQLTTGLLFTWKHVYFRSIGTVTASVGNRSDFVSGCKVNMLFGGMPLILRKWFFSLVEGVCLWDLFDMEKYCMSGISQQKPMV